MWRGWVSRSNGGEGREANPKVCASIIGAPQTVTHFSESPSSPPTHPTPPHPTHTTTTTAHFCRATQGGSPRRHGTRPAQQPQPKLFRSPLCFLSVSRCDIEEGVLSLLRKTRLCLCGWGWGGMGVGIRPTRARRISSVNCLSAQQHIYIIISIVLASQNAPLSDPLGLTLSFSCLQSANPELSHPSCSDLSGACLRCQGSPRAPRIWRC